MAEKLVQLPAHREYLLRVLLCHDEPGDLVTVRLPIRPSNVQLASQVRPALNVIFVRGRGGTPGKQRGTRTIAS